MPHRTLARIGVTGVVQGVGFRPFIFRLAHEHNLAGWVRNTSGQVEIQVEGDEEDLQRFLWDLAHKCPPMARIGEVTNSFHAPEGLHDFVIRDSLAKEGEYQLVAPDIATCEDCIAELLSPEDRRHRYPFTNCTNCGPRFTIIEDIPYDRPKTTMRHFTMCPDCQREYDDPFDRRFHAQPNACPICGPSLTLTDSGGNPIIEHTKPDQSTRTVDMLKADIKIEKQVADAYDKAAKEVKDAGLKELLLRIRDNERYHIDVFNDLLKKEK